MNKHALQWMSWNLSVSFLRVPLFGRFKGKSEGTPHTLFFFGGGGSKKARVLSQMTSFRYPTFAIFGLSSSMHGHVFENAQTPCGCCTAKLSPARKAELEGILNAGATYQTKKESPANVLFGCFGRKIDGFPWFPWFPGFPGFPGGSIIYQGNPSICPKRTPMVTPLSV